MFPFKKIEHTASASVDECRATKPPRQTYNRHTSLKKQAHIKETLRQKYFFLVSHGLAYNNYLHGIIKKGFEQKHVTTFNFCFWTFKIHLFSKFCCAKIDEYIKGFCLGFNTYLRKQFSVFVFKNHALLG